MQQIETGAVGLVLGVVIRQPFFVFDGAGLLDGGHRQATLLVLGEVDVHLLASQVQVGFGDLADRLGVFQLAEGAAKIGADFRARAGDLDADLGRSTSSCEM